MKHSEVLEGRWDWLAKAILERKVVGFQNPLIDSTSKTTNLFFDCVPEEYKVIEPEAYRPWTADEVPMPCVVRSKAFPNRRIQILEVHNNYVLIVGYESITFDQLLENYEYAVDAQGQITWHPCGQKVS